MKYFFLIFLIEVQLIYNVGLISGVQQSSFHILFHVLFIYFIYFFIFFSIVAHNNIEYSSLCYIVGPCFFILYVVVCICQSQICNLSLPHCLPNLAIINLFSMLVSLVLFINKFLCIFFLLSLSLSLPFPRQWIPKCVARHIVQQQDISSASQSTPEKNNSFGAI